MVSLTLHAVVTTCYKVSFLAEHKERWEEVGGYYNRKSELVGKLTQDIRGKEAGLKETKKIMGIVDNFTFRMNNYWHVSCLCRDLLLGFGGDQLVPGGYTHQIREGAASFTYKKAFPCRMNIVNSHGNNHSFGNGEKVICYYSRTK